MALNLDSLQFDILKIIWDNQPVVVSDIKQILDVRGRSVTVSTIGTVLKRMEKRGIVEYSVEGKKYVYTAKLAEDDVKKTFMRKAKEQLFNGKGFDLVNHLLNEEMLTQEEIKALKQKIKNLK